jgi:hypothetical protein
LVALEIVVERVEEGGELVDGIEWQREHEDSSAAFQLKERGAGNVLRQSVR